MTKQQQLPQQASSKVFSILFENDEVTWKQIIFGLIEQEEMNPWDIDISVIAQKFIEMLKTLKQMDFRISGKIVLASAILLKLKSSKLVDEDIAALDSLINSADDPVELEFIDELPLEEGVDIDEEKPRIVPRTPQPRKRKVSVFDLVEALEKALDVDSKRVRHAPTVAKEAHAPTSHVDMGVLVKEVYGKVNTHYKENSKVLNFHDLVPGDNKDDKVLTFIPLLHLDFQRKLDVMQQEHFGDIAVHLLEADADFTPQELSPV